MAGPLALAVAAPQTTVAHSAPILKTAGAQQAAVADPSGVAVRALVPDADLPQRPRAEKHHTGLEVEETSGVPYRDLLTIEWARRERPRDPPDPHPHAVNGPYLRDRFIW
ncbi:hypothetical protein [Streptomyces goshikiensis]